MTSSAVDSAALAAARRRVFLALFAALAVAVHTLEALLPAPAPWFRLGFANILTLTALFLYGSRGAWSVTLARIGLGSLLLGNLFAPGFFLSLAGGTLATALMTAARRLGGRAIGPVGVSVVGAAGHALGQMLIAWLLLVRHDGIWRIFPFFLLASLVTGIANGLVAHRVLQLLRQQPAFAAGKEAP